MTSAEAWDVLDAAAAIGRAHGCECDPVIGRGVLSLRFWRGEAGGSMAVVLTEAELNACADSPAVKELVERRVVEAFKLHGHARRATA